MSPTHIQQQLAQAYQNPPHAWLSLSEAEVDAMGEALDGRLHTIKPPLPTFPAKDVQEELSRLERKRFVGVAHE